MSDANGLLQYLLFSARHPLVKTAAVVSLLSVLIMLSVGVGYWWPVARGYSELLRQTETKRKEVINSVRAADISRAYSHSAKQIEVLERKLNIEAAQTDLVKYLSQLAIKQNIKIISEVYEEGQVQTGYVPLHLDLNLQGSYPALRRFISGLQSLPTWTYVREGTISGSQEGLGVLKAHLRLVTYRKIKAGKAQDA